jgi:hypothetical protein
MRDCLTVCAEIVLDFREATGMSLIMGCTFYRKLTSTGQINQVVPRFWQREGSIHG